LSATVLPNQATDSIRRFVVLAWKPKRGDTIPSRQRPTHVGWRVYDRAGFVADRIFATPQQRFDSSTDELAEAYAEAEDHRRRLNLCEAFGHLFDVIAERCATCGVEP
jgi:hypothetical protein